MEPKTISTTQPGDKRRERDNTSAPPDKRLRKQPASPKLLLLRPPAPLLLHSPAKTCTLYPLPEHSCIGLSVSQSAVDSSIVTVNSEPVTAPTILRHGDVLALHSQYIFCLCTDVSSISSSSTHKRQTPKNPLYVEQLTSLLSSNLQQPSTSSLSPALMEMVPQRALVELETILKVSLNKSCLPSHTKPILTNQVLLEGPINSGINHEEIVVQLASTLNTPVLLVPQGFFTSFHVPTPKRPKGGLKLSRLDDDFMDDDYSGLDDNLDDDISIEEFDDDDKYGDDSNQSTSSNALLGMVLSDRSLPSHIRQTLNRVNPKNISFVVDDGTHQYPGDFKRSYDDSQQKKTDDGAVEAEDDDVSVFTSLVDSLEPMNDHECPFKVGDRVVFESKKILASDGNLDHCFNLPPSKATGTVVYSINHKLVAVDFDKPFKSSVALNGLSPEPSAGAVVNADSLILEDTSALNFSPTDALDILGDFVADQCKDDSQKLVVLIHDPMNCFKSYVSQFKLFQKKLNDLPVCLIISLPRHVQSYKQSSAKDKGFSGLLELVSNKSSDNPFSSASQRDTTLPPPVDDTLAKLFTFRIVTSLPMEQGTQLINMEKKFTVDAKIINFKANMVMLRLGLVFIGCRVPDNFISDLESNETATKSLSRTIFSVVDVKRILLIAISQSAIISATTLTESVIKWVEVKPLTHPTPKTSDEVSRSVSQLFAGAARRLKECSADDDHEDSVLNEAMPPGRLKISFGDIGSLDDIKNDLVQHLILPLRRPELFSASHLSKSSKGVLLFGPPGTGKTMLAKAVAAESGAVFIPVSSATLGSKFFGDSERLARALFLIARKLAPSIIFLDEADALLGSRSGGQEHEANRKIKNILLEMWDGLSSDPSKASCCPLLYKPSS
ncbi:hypothetical protein GEMRC1_005888 [Eukaryota sp. GEM-RC1]